MKNIIFDFDSTLIKKESLELILESVLKDSPGKIVEIEKITNLGMQGDLDFRESLERRLAIASPTKQSIKDFADKYCPNMLTDGILELVNELKNKDYQIWIFSGGLTESVEPFANYLGISKQNIFAVDITWDSNGNFVSLNNFNSACDSKLKAFEKTKALIDGEVIVVGDGYTDYQLYEAGFANKFIAYTEHVSRQKVIEVADNIAKDINQLKSLIF